MPAVATTPAVPAAPDGLTQDDRTTGMLCHLVGILAGIIGALIMHLCMKDRSAFVLHHAKESLNFQITLLIIEFALVIVSIISGLVTFGFAFIVTVPVTIAVIITFLVLEIIACMAASRGEWHRYPFAFRFVK